VPVKIALDPKDPLTVQLRPGLSVTATVDTRMAPQTTAPQPTVNQAQR
jgi:membrane fusion protein (multidrug efflux system)